MGSWRCGLARRRRRSFSRIGRRGNANSFSALGRSVVRRNSYGLSAKSPGHDGACKLPRSHRDSLKTEIVYQAVEQRRGIVPFNCGTQRLVTKLIEQVERASETADLVDQANSVIKHGCLEVVLYCDWPRAPPDVLAAWCPLNSNQRHELTLGVGVTVDIPLSGLYRTMTGEKLNISQRGTGVVDQPGGSGDESATARMR